MKNPRGALSEADLHAYVDGESAPERRQDIEAALGRDPAQAARVDMWRRQNEIIRATFARVASEPLPLSLSLSHHGAVRLEPVERLATPSGSSEPIRVVGRGLFDRETSDRSGKGRLVAVGAAAFIAGGVVALCGAAMIGVEPRHLAPPYDVVTAHVLAPVILQQGPGGPADDFAGSLLASRAVEAHRTYARDLMHPVDVDDSDSLALSTWLSQRVSVPISPPDLSTEGLRLLGGRITPGEYGPAAFLVYQKDNGDRIGLFIARMQHETALPLRYQQGRTFNAAIWISNGAGYAFTGPEDSDHLLQLARQMRAGMATNPTAP